MSHAVFGIYFYLKHVNKEPSVLLGNSASKWVCLINRAPMYMSSNGLGGITVRNINLGVINSFKYYMCKELLLLTSPGLGAAKKWELKSWIDEIHESKHVIKARKQWEEHWYLENIFIGSDMATESDEEEKMEGSKYNCADA